MKRIIKGILIGIVFAAPIALFSDTPSPLEDRTATINFQGQLVDSSERPYDGTVDIEARFYGSPERLPENLVYAEEFADVDVDHGLLRIPLFGGTPLEGTVCSIDSFAALAGLYVDIIINGAPFLEGWPVASQLAAIRAEHVLTAEALRQPISLSPSNIDRHRALLISSGVLNISRLPPIPGTKIIDDLSTPQVETFPVSMIPLFDAGKVTSGLFDANAFQNGISAAWFATGKVNESLIPYEAMRKADIGILMGEASQGTAVQIPGGFDRTQCSWMVSVKRFNEDVGERDGIDHLMVMTDGNGVVTCVFDTDTGAGPPTRPCTANYLTICKK